jgi:hypothetical protein
MRNMIMSFAEKFNGKEVKIMKSLLAIVIAITMVISTSGLSFAAFSSIGSETFSASTSVGGSADVTVPFEANLKNLTNDASASSVSWSAVTGGVTGWKAAGQYIAVKGFATYSDWGIQIYTNNTNYTGTGNPAGLVNTGKTIYSLPMCWRTKVGYYDEDKPTETKKGSESIIANELKIVDGKSDGFNILYDGVTPKDLDPKNEDDTTKVHAPGQATSYFPWFYMLDKGTPDVDLKTKGNQAFGTHQQEATFIGSAGYHHAPGEVAENFATPSHPKDTYYVYLGANFTMAIPEATYTTNSLTVEMYRL